ncbi:MAG: hypothetical protein KDA89_08560, partial [Planctomycetaceae bacterium]|nr:hypothetical protein [Planctomycetaceae bacterium]
MIRSFLRRAFGMSAVTSRRRRISVRPSVAMELLEVRSLLSGITMLGGSGRLIYSGTAADESLTVSFAAGEYTFTAGAAETITVGTNISDLDPAANVVRFSAAASETAAGVAISSLEINTAGGTDTVAINSIRSATERLEVSNSGAGDTVTVGGDLGSAGSRIGGTVILRGTAISLGGDIFTNNQAVTLDAPATLTADVQIDAGTGSVALNGAVDGTFDLDVIGGFLDLNQADIGATTALRNFSATGANSQVLGVRVTTDVDIRSNIYSVQGALTSTGGSGVATIAPRDAASNLTLSFGTVANPISNDFSGFTQVAVGDTTTGTLTINNDGIDGIGSGVGSGPAGNLDVGAPLTLTGASVVVTESINNGTNSIQIFADSVNFSGQGSPRGTGAVDITKLNAGGTLNLAGIGNRYWGLAPVTVNAAGATANFVGAVGAQTSQLNVTADVINLTHFTAIVATGTVTLNATTVNLNGGIQAGGTVQINGNLVLSGTTTFLIGGGGNLSVTGTTTANNQRITIRGAGGVAIGTISLGDVVGANLFRIDSSGAATAGTVNLNDLSALDIIVRGNVLTTDGTVTATGGNVFLAGNLTLNGNTSLSKTSGSSLHYVRVVGTINGAFDLNINSGNGVTVLTAGIGGVTPLNSATISSGGLNFLTVPIVVTNGFTWTVGTNGN